MSAAELRKVESRVIGRSLRQPDSQDFVLEHYRSARYRDALFMEYEQGEVWLFDYGVLVSWDLKDEQVRALIKRLDDLIVEPALDMEMESYTFSTGGGELLMHRDHIRLSGDGPQERLAVSHALAQSAKLAMFESQAQRVIHENEYISQALASTGKIPLSRRELAKLRGTLFSVTSDILLNFNLLDTPEYFWDYPELEPHYSHVSRYLDIVPRITVLNKKLDTIHELLNMLASEQNHKHSSMLEWIIILLIAMEIIIFFWH
jgi:uncharacterized Rmd1/YagE family protein